MSQTDRLISLTALGIVMLYNELWNIVLFRWQNPYLRPLGCSLRHPLVLCIMEIESPRTGKSGWFHLFVKICSGLFFHKSIWQIGIFS